MTPLWSLAWDPSSTFGFLDKARWVGAVPKWAFSTTNDPASYTVCDFTMGPCLTAPGTVTPPGSTLLSNWRGRPVLAANRLGHVAMILLYNKDSDLEAEGVAVVMSEDGGRTYKYMVDATNAGAGDGCETGVQDSPHGSWDLTAVPPRLYVTWKHNNQEACMRQFRLAPVGMPPIPTLFAFDFARKIQHIDSDHGSVKVRAADNAVTVVYQHVGQVHDCADLLAKGGTPPLPGVPSKIADDARWGSVTTFDDGLHWTENSDIMKTNAYEWCFFSTDTAANTPPGFQRTMGEFDFVLGTDGHAYVAINGGQNEIFLFMSPIRGVKPQGGSQDDSWWLWCPTGPSGNFDYPWQPLSDTPEYDGKTNAFKNGLGCSVPFVRVPLASGFTAFHPTLAAGGNGEIHYLDYESSTTTVGMTVFPTVFPFYRGNVLPRAYGVGTGVPFAQTRAARSSSAT